MAYYVSSQINECLNKKSIVANIYTAMESENAGEVIGVALNNLGQSQKIAYKEVGKCKQKSEDFLKFGNTVFTEGKIVMALQSYNQALLCAPKSSVSMMLAYYARSKLLLKIEGYEECLKDIETCHTLHPPEDIKENLRCMKSICQEKKAAQCLEYNIVSENKMNFFKLPTNTNPDIPCAIDAVKIVTDKGLPKVTAGKVINIGTLVTVEKAYATCVHKNNSFISCYYCHKFAFNLIPCDNCYYCLFCSEQCKIQAVKEYHSIECPIVDTVDKISARNMEIKLPFKAAINLRNRCDSWEEFIEINKSIGLSRLQKGSVNDIFDVNNKLSILGFNDDRHFLYGGMFNASIHFASIVWSLAKHTSFFPVNKIKRDEAIRAFGGLMLNLYSRFHGNVKIINVAMNFSSQSVTPTIFRNTGYFSFTSKLRHKCDANLLCVGLNDRVALIAIRDIREGEELNISFLDHWYGTTFRESRATQLCLSREIICDCCVCAGNWDRLSVKHAVLTSQERKAYDSWKKFIDKPYRGEKLRYQRTCSILQNFNKHLNTIEHLQLFKFFRSEINSFQFFATKNVAYE